jgi:threonine/homoserine/homoserine lactone efflux protein
VFLVVVGVMAIVRPGRRAQAPRRLGSNPFLTGLLTNLGNPKALLFFLSVLPQFLPASTVAALPTALALATIPVACRLAGLSLWAILSGRLRAQLQTPRARRIQARIMGSVLVALGIRVAAER